MHNAGRLDKYTLLPSWWHAMTSDEKKNAFDIISRRMQEDALWSV